eukprot:GHVN01068247.1.p1 GENE.GHVN01068247.1~~GHVN01068247.1.p1  ORF type:complete len:176 (+),score=15.14 GHVN01068247.1:313-840(+)
MIECSLSDGDLVMFRHNTDGQHFWETLVTLLRRRANVEWDEVGIVVHEHGVAHVATKTTKGVKMKTYADFLADEQPFVMAVRSLQCPMFIRRSVTRAFRASVGLKPTDFDSGDRTEIYESGITAPYGANLAQRKRTLWQGLTEGRKPDKEKQFGEAATYMELDRLLQVKWKVVGD